MIVRLKKSDSLFWAFFLVTLGDSQFLINIGMNKIIEYAGLMIILFSIYNLAEFKKQIKNIPFSGVLILFFCIGLAVQNLTFSKKLGLILSMCILTSIAVFSSKYIKSVRDIRKLGLGILSGIAVSVLLAVIFNISLITPASEGIIVGFGINGGMIHRNYFAYTVLAYFIAMYIYCSNSDCVKRTDKFLLYMGVVLLLVSNSRSSYIIFLIFIFAANYRKIKTMKYQRAIMIGITAAVFIGVGIPFFKLITADSKNFNFRISGLQHYLNAFASDRFHMIYGNAEMAFRDSGSSYANNIRSVIGWDGSVELVVLNIIIKNGLLGLAGYILLFTRYFKRLSYLANDKLNIILFALLFSFIVSSFVEAYVADINKVYTVFCYMMLASASVYKHKLAGLKEAGELF